MSTDLESAVRCPPPDGIVDQRVWLPERAAGRRVVHLGCVDDRLTEERAGTGDLLHEELAKVAAELVGVDISAAGIELMRTLVPGPYEVGDVEHLGDLDLPECDLVIAAEIIEHLGSPGLFLSGLRDYLAGTGASALITTPNALGWRIMAKWTMRRREVTHPDHRLIYTPTTLLRTMELSGLRVDGLWSHTWMDDRLAGKQRAVDAVDRTLLRWNPWMGVGIIVEVRASTA